MRVGEPTSRRALIMPCCCSVYSLTGPISVSGAGAAIIFVVLAIIGDQKRRWMRYADERAVGKQSGAGKLDGGEIYGQRR